MDEKRRNEIALALVENTPRSTLTSTPLAAEVYAQFKSLSPLNELRGVCAYPLWIHALREIYKAAAPEEVRRMYTTARVLMRFVPCDERSKLIADTMKHAPFSEHALQQLITETPGLRKIVLPQEELREFIRDSMVQMIIEDCT